MCHRVIIPLKKFLTPPHLSIHVFYPFPSCFCAKTVAGQFPATTRSCWIPVRSTSGSWPSQPRTRLKGHSYPPLPPLAPFVFLIGGRQGCRSLAPNGERTVWRRRMGHSKSLTGRPGRESTQALFIRGHVSPGKSYRGHGAGKRA